MEEVADDDPSPPQGAAQQQYRQPPRLELTMKELSDPQINNEPWCIHLDPEEDNL